jgi:N-acetylglucosamine-6-phosphate deacetylase
MMPETRTAIIAPTLFDGTEIRRHRAVIVEGSRICWTGPAAQLAKDVPCHSLPPTAWLAPGFIDIQVNGGGDELFNASPTAKTLRHIASAHRRFGTTGLLPTLITDTSAKMQAAAEAVQHTSVKEGILGVHFEGPFLSPEKAGVHDQSLIRRPSEVDLRLLCSLSGKSVVVTLAPERVEDSFLVKLAEKGVRLALGHSMATYHETKRSFANGVTGITHLFNAMRGLESREPGPIAATLENPNIWFGMIVDDVHVAPAMLRLALRGNAHPMLVTDAMPPAAGRRASFQLFGQEITVQGPCCVTASGKLAGTALNMASAVRNCTRLLGIPLSAALRFASLEPARFLGIDDRLGRLAPGYRADMVALNPDTLAILGTWLGGKWQASP